MITMLEIYTILKMKQNEKLTVLEFSGTLAKRSVENSAVSDNVFVHVLQLISDARKKPLN